MGGLLEAVLDRLGSRLGASVGPLQGLFGPLGGLSVASVGPLQGLFGPLGGKGSTYQFASPPSWAPLGGLLGLGPPWVVLGGLLGSLGAIVGASWAVLKRREAEKTRTPKPFNNLRRSMIFASPGPFWECSWSFLGASRRRLGPSGGNLGRPEVIFWRFEALLGCLSGLLRPSWPVTSPCRKFLDFRECARMHILLTDTSSPRRQSGGGRGLRRH